MQNWIELQNGDLLCLETGAEINIVELRDECRIDYKIFGGTVKELLKITTTPETIMQGTPKDICLRTLGKIKERLKSRMQLIDMYD